MLPLSSTVEDAQKSDGVRALKPLPPIGDVRKTYAVELTEPEINMIHAVLGFCDGQIRTLAHFPQNDFTQYVRLWWSHYGPTLWALSARLRQFDDGDTPYQSANAAESQPTSDKSEERQKEEGK